MKITAKPSQPLLPWEIIDKILLYLNGLIAVDLNRFCVASKLIRWGQALEHGKLEYLKYLFTRGLCVEEGLLSSTYLSDLTSAAENNNLNTIIPRAMDLAAAEGHIEVVQWLHENCDHGCTTDAMDLASKSGHLAVVKCLHENRKEECTTDAMDNAAKMGHLKVVEYLYYNRKEACTQKVLFDVAWRGHRDVLEFLYSKNRYLFMPIMKQLNMFLDHALI